MAYIFIPYKVHKIFKVNDFCIWRWTPSKQHSSMPMQSNFTLCVCVFFAVCMYNIGVVVLFSFSCLFEWGWTRMVAMVNGKVERGGSGWAAWHCIPQFHWRHRHSWNDENCEKNFCSRFESEMCYTILWISFQYASSLYFLHHSISCLLPKKQEEK